MSARRRPSIAACLSVGCLSAACAAPRAPAAHAQGAPIAPGMRSAAGLSPGAPFTPWGADSGLARDARPAAKAAGADAVERALVSGPAEAALALGFVAYKATWSRLDGPTCAFSPSCSRFGLDAVRALGPLGVVYTFGRLMRDHTAHEHYAPAPPYYLADPLTNYTFFWRSGLLEREDADPTHRSWRRARAQERGR